ncbi:MAG: hypothetical protein QOI88_1381 [Gammaproteobacteria bacterium]|jgi:hypothetical protein|nr:hypothetical protein [Gammaproteobacteria bacterium]
MPSPHASHEINIRSSRFYIARTVSTCWHCGSPTALVALAVPPGHETLDVDDEVSAWSVADHNAFLFYIDFLPAAIQDRLNQHLPSYRRGDGALAAGSYWANHCGRCGSRLDDHELFCEPEGAFSPTSESTAAAIRLAAVDEAFETSAAGYSYEPQYFSAMDRG